MSNEIENIESIEAKFEAFERWSNTILKHFNKLDQDVLRIVVDFRKKFSIFNAMEIDKENLVKDWDEFYKKSIQKASPVLVSGVIVIAGLADEIGI